MQERWEYRQTITELLTRLYSNGFLIQTISDGAFSAAWKSSFYNSDNNPQYLHLAVEMKSYKTERSKRSENKLSAYMMLEELS